MVGFVIGDRGLGTAGDTHPAWMMGYATVGPCLAVGASAIGQLHLREGRPRDDAFVVRASGPWLAVAVADGVGSRPHSRYGATYVAEALSAYLLRPLVPLPKQAPEDTPLPPASSGNVAPPPEAEEIHIRVGSIKGVRRLKLKPGVATLAVGLKDWSQVREDWSQILAKEERRPPEGFLQAASVGWWIAPPSAGAPDEGTQPAPSEGISSAQPDSGIPVKPDLAEIARRAFVNTHLGLREHARALGLELADLSCTALALLVNVETGDGVVGQLGDGAILGLTAQGKVLELLQAPGTGDPQATYTLNKPNFEHHLALQAIRVQPPADPFVAFFVMTDGLSGDLLYSPHEKALENWAQKVDRNLRLSPTPAQAAAGMLNWLATYTVVGSWDDRTLVAIIWKDRERNYGNRPSDAEQPGIAGTTDH